MAVERIDLESLDRDRLIERARATGIERPEVLTRLELLDEILSASIADDQERRAARGLLGRARDLVARVGEKGLNLPDAAQRLRTMAPPMAAWRRAPAPIATVSLAEIYAGQGHDRLARKVLDEVLEREPDHRYARMLRDRMSAPAQAADCASAHASDAEAPLQLEPPAPSVHIDESGAQPTQALDPAPAAPHPAILPARLSQRELPLDNSLRLQLNRRTAQLRWQLRPGSFAHARAMHSDGRLIVRVVRVEANWQGPRVESEDVRVDALSGGLIRELPGSASAVCAAIAWLSDHGFAPLASCSAELG